MKSDRASADHALCPAGQRPEESSAKAIDQLEPILYSSSPNAIKQQLKLIVPEDTPHLE